MLIKNSQKVRLALTASRNWILYEKGSRLLLVSTFQFSSFPLQSYTENVKNLTSNVKEGCQMTDVGMRKGELA